MITTKQRAYLKSLAHKMEPVLLIGKGGVTGNTLRQIDDLLNKRELIKIKILNNNLDDKDDIINTILESLNAEFVQFIGSKFIIYRESDEKKIELPK